MERVAVDEIALERLLGRDRDPLRVEVEVARVDPARAVAQQSPDLARQHGAQLPVVQGGELTDRRDARGREPLFRARADAGEQRGSGAARGTAPRSPAGRP